MVACSPVEEPPEELEEDDEGARAGSDAGAAGAGVERMGSGVDVMGDGPDWVGFHIALKMIPFLSCWDGFQGRSECMTKKLKSCRAIDGDAQTYFRMRSLLRSYFLLGDPGGCLRLLYAVYAQMDARH